MPPRKRLKPEAEPLVGSEETTKGTLGEQSRQNANDKLEASPESSPSISATDAVSQTKEATHTAPSSSKASIRSKTSMKNMSEYGGEHGELRRKASGRLWRNGTWNAKAAPVAEVARESIGAVSDSRDIRKDSTTSLSSTYLSRSFKGSIKDQKAATVKRPNSSASLYPENGDHDAMSDNNVKATQQASTVPDATDKAENAISKDTMPNSDADSQRSSDEPSSSIQITSWGWRGWWTKPDTQASQADPKEPRSFTKALSSQSKETLQKASGPLENASKGKLDEPDDDVHDDQTQLDENRPADVTSPSSWFWGWSIQQNMRNPTAAPDTMTQDKAEDRTADGADKTTDQPAKSASPESSSENSKGQKTSGWAFWSVQKPDSKKTGSTQKQVGELAVSDTPSQSKPEVAQFNEQKLDRGKDKAARSEKPKSLTNDKKAKPSTAKAFGQTEQPSQGEELITSQKSAVTIVKPPTSQTNLLLPTFDTTFASAHSPTYWQQLRSWIYGQEAQREHLNLAVAPPKIKSALAIGIHGFFPASIVQRVIGQPTGTSIRFANMGADAIAEWAKARGYKCKIEKVALEGEGMIAERVDTLWKLLLNWVDHIRRSDFVLITCHSQGVPVSVMLLSKLLEFGCLSSSVRVGVCAMAGINLGPFGDFKSKLFGATAFELFEFSRQNSAVTERHLGSLERCLRHGVRIVYTASLDDQLVSLEVGI